MVVAQIVESDSPGGTERLMIQLALELRRRGHEVVAAGPADGSGWLGREFTSRGFVWEPLRRRFMFDPRAVADIVRLIRRHKVDAVHAHEFAPSVFGSAAAWLTGLPCVITMHSNPYYAQKWRRRQAFRWAYRHARAVVGVSADTSRDAERVLGLPAGAIHVIPNGIASEPGRRDPLRRELALADDDLLVVAIGNVSARKAHIILLRSMIELARRRPALRWHLAVAGTDQGAMPELVQVAAEHGLTDRLHLLGHRQDTEDVLAAADVFAMSSLHEGMPLAIMEAMFAGKPVITSTAGGIGEMMVDGAEGLLVPVNDVPAMAAGLERLLADGALRERLAAAGRERAVRQFGIGPMMDAYERFYRC